MHPEVKKYLEKQPTLQKDILEKIRALIQRVAPEAEEGMSYGVPAFKMTKNLVLYAAFKHHVGIYPEPATIEVFEDELKEYETSKGAIKFNIDKPIPYDLIEKIVRYRYQQLHKKN